MTKKTRILTGITASGIPHLGNYAGAIRPCIENSLLPNTESYFFIADYHALIKCNDPNKVAQSRMSIAATWLAAGLDPNKVHLYLQSDIPEVTELSWILTCLCPKGLANRAHAYKACVDQNQEKGLDIDEGVSMGLYSYPILMAADILLFNAHQVPVGRDQIQHLEMTRDLAQRFNFHYGRGKEVFVYPQAYIEERVATLPGLDGRKMSKSYQNTIPLFEGSDKQLKETIFKIKTDSKLPNEPKDPHSNSIYTLYKAFAPENKTQLFEESLKNGLAWGDAKQELYELLSHIISPMRETYQRFLAHPKELEDILKQGAERIRPEAQAKLEEVKELVGLSTFHKIQTTSHKTKEKSKLGKFVQFKDQDGLFYARLQDAQGEPCLLTHGFSQPKLLGQLIRHTIEHFDDSMMQEINSKTHLTILDQILATIEDSESVPRIKGTLKAIKESR